MEAALQDTKIKESEIHQNLLTVKPIIANSKHASFNDGMKNGFKLIQEMPTRFGTTYDTVHRFIKCARHVRLLLDFKYGDASDKVRKAFVDLKQEVKSDVSLFFQI